jgi:hypothetical protein
LAVSKCVESSKRCACAPAATPAILAVEPIALDEISVALMVVGGLNAFTGLAMVVRGSSWL